MSSCSQSSSMITQQHPRDAENWIFENHQFRLELCLYQQGWGTQGRPRKKKTKLGCWPNSDSQMNWLAGNEGPETKQQIPHQNCCEYCNPRRDTSPQQGSYAHYEQKMRHWQPHQNYGHYVHENNNYYEWWWVGAGDQNHSNKLFTPLPERVGAGGQNHSKKLFAPLPERVGVGGQTE